MNREIKRLLLLLVILFMGILFKEFLLYIGFNDKKLIYDLISKIVIRFILTIFVLYLIIKWGYSTFLNQYKNIFVTSLIILPIVFISFQYVQDDINNSKLSVGLFENTIYFISSFATGLYEELLFRILAFSLIFTYFGNNKENFFKSVILTSLFFGISHFINLYKITSYSIIIQVLMATGFGLLFQSILLRFKNIFIVIIMHTLINYLGMYKHYLEFPSSINEIDETSSFLSSIIWVIFIIGSIIIPISYLIIKPVIRKSE